MVEDGGEEPGIGLSGEIPDLESAGRREKGRSCGREENRGNVGERAQPPDFQCQGTHCGVGTHSRQGLQATVGRVCRLQWAGSAGYSRPGLQATVGRVCRLQ
jgi:hypothetical protein